MTMNTTAIEFRILDQKLNEAETVLINLKDMMVDPMYQMREKMDHDNIALYAESLEDLPPVRVFEVDGDLILTDGFHRYFAHELAEAEEIKAKVIEGTAFEAMAYAMAANFTHLKGGSKPTKDDQKKAILRLFALLEDRFEYDSKVVVPTLKAYGITCSDRHIRTWTTEGRESIDEKRTAKIEELHESGSTIRAIAAEIGCGVATVDRVLNSVPKRNCSVSEQEPEAPFADETSTDDAAPWDATTGFDEDDLEEVELVNPADAFNKTLKELDTTLQQDSENIKVPSVTSPTIPADVNVTAGESHLIGVLNQLRAIRNSDTYAEQLSALVDNDADYAQSLIKTALLFSEDLEAADSI